MARSSEAYEYDVFLSHNSDDKPAVETIARQLEAEGLRPFLDKWHAVPGEPWQEALEEALAGSRTVAVFIGKTGLNPWHDEEMRTALDRAVPEKKSVIPVLLAGGDRSELPSFLSRRTWVDLSIDPSDLHDLIAAIRGQAPGSRSDEEQNRTLTSRLEELYDRKNCLQRELEPRSEDGQAKEGRECEGGKRDAQIGRSGLPAKVVAGFGVGAALSSLALAIWASYGASPAFVRIDPGPVNLTAEGSRTVEIQRPYALKRTEVTQGEWEAVMGNQPAFFKACGEDCPVERVSWYDAVAYLNRLSEKEGRERCYELRCTEENSGLGEGCSAETPDVCSGGFRCTEVRFRGFSCEGYRLPTEAEWLRAVRAEASGPVGHEISAVDFEILGEFNAPALDTIAWYGGNSAAAYIQAHHCDGLPEKQMPGLSACGPQPVATKAPNPWGIYDGLGNVWEWTHSGYGPKPALEPADMGGSWYAKAADTQLSARYTLDPGLRAFDLGFRWARTLPR